MDTTQRWNYRKGLAPLIAAAILSSFCSALWASGFQLVEQNASNLGTAYAGAVSEGANASTGYYNPGALTRLGEEQIVGSLVFVSSQAKVNATSALATAPVLFSGVARARANNTALIPALHYAKRIDGCWVFGFNIASPFGLKNNFRNDSVVRYMATRSELRSVDLSPSLGYDFRNGFSLGAGVDALYVSAKLDSRLGTGNPVSDGFIENTASNWGMGYHIGALYEFTECTRVGAQYRSKVKVNTRGQSIRLVPVGLGGTGLEAVQAVRARITLPETATLSAYHQMNTQWALMADFQWTHWKRFQTLALGFADGTQSITTENFRDSVRVSAGLSYQYCDPWLFKVGTAFDKTPVRDSNRTVRVPDQNRIWAALGAQYRFCKNLSLDLGYAHLFFKKANINEVAPRAVPFTGQTSQNLRATSKSRADLIGIQLTWDLV